MDKVFIVVKKGINDQGVFGVYGDIDTAMRAALRAEALESDNYHVFEVRAYVFNKDAATVPATKPYRNPDYEAPVVYTTEKITAPDMRTGWEKFGG